MNKLKRWGLAAAVLCLGLIQAGTAGAAAPKNTYKPASGGYTQAECRQEIIKTAPRNGAKMKHAPHFGAKYLRVFY